MPQPILPDVTPDRLIARLINFYGSVRGLLAAKPNWDTEVKVSMELPTDISKQPITFVESRRNFAQSARYHMEWTSYLSSARGCHRVAHLSDRASVSIPILVPLWPDVCEVKNPLVAGQRLITSGRFPARYSAVWIITDEDFTSWELVIISALDLPNSALRLPVGGVTRAYPAGTRPTRCWWGDWKNNPSPKRSRMKPLTSPSRSKRTRIFRRRSPQPPLCYAWWAPTSRTFQTAYLWDITPNHARPLDWTEMPDIVYEEVGFLRAGTTAGVRSPHSARTGTGVLPG